MGWSFELLGETFHESELTLDDLVTLEDEFGVTWAAINPLRSARQGRRIAAGMYAKRCGVSLDEALTKVGQESALAFVDAVEPNADPPKANAT